MTRAGATSKRAGKKAERGREKITRALNGKIRPFHRANAFPPLLSKAEESNAERLAAGFSFPLSLSVSF